MTACHGRVHEILLSILTSCEAAAAAGRRTAAAAAAVTGGSDLDDAADEDDAVGEGKLQFLRSVCMVCGAVCHGPDANFNVPRAAAIFLDDAGPRLGPALWMHGFPLRHEGRVCCVCAGAGGYKAAEGRKQRKHHLAELKGLLPPSHTPLLVTLLLEQHTLFAQQPAASAAGGWQQQQQLQESAGSSAAAQEAGGSLRTVRYAQQDGQLNALQYIVSCGALP